MDAVTRKTKPARPADRAAPGGKVARPESTRITLRLEVDLHDRLQAMADERRMTVSTVIRTAVEMYFAREEFALSLAAMEGNIAATIERNSIEVMHEAGQTRNDIQMLFGLIDTLLHFTFATTPEIIDKQGANALGNARYAGFMSEIKNKFKTQNRRRKAVLHTKLVQLTGGEADE